MIMRPTPSSPNFVRRNQYCRCRNILPPTPNQHKSTSTMTRSGILRIGEGARCSVLLSMLRPSQAVAERFPAIMPRQRLDDLMAVRHEMVTRNRSTYEAIFFTSFTFPGQEMHCARRYAVVQAEGHQDAFWEEREVEVSAPPADLLQEGVDSEPIDESIFTLLGSSSSSRAEDIALVRAQGFLRLTMTMSQSRRMCPVPPPRVVCILVRSGGGMAWTAGL